MPALPALLLRRAAAVLDAGGVIAYPTEAVFGLGCLPEDEDAIRRVLDIKQRSADAGLIIIAADKAQLEGWYPPGQPLPADDPAGPPTTWIVPAGPLATPLLTGGRDTLAVRLTRHPLAAALCRAAASPLVSTSANRHGRPPARSALAVRLRLGAAVDLVVPGDTLGAARPSRIIDLASGRVLRDA